MSIDLQLPATAVHSVIDFAVGETKPDLTLLLILPRSEALRRLAQRNAGTAPVEDRFEAEKEAFFQRVEAGYRSLAAAEPQRVRRVDAAGDVDAVAEQVWTEVGRILS